MQLKSLVSFLVLFASLASTSVMAQDKVFFEKLETKDDLYLYQGKPYTGTSVLLFDSKKTWQRVEWKDGKIHGWFKSWYVNGHPDQEVQYENGKRHGSFHSHYDNGNDEIVCTYYNGLRNGVFTEYYKSGVPKRKVNYDMGVKNGPLIILVSKR